MARSRCFQDYIDCNRDCAGLPNFIDRVACGFDCELDLVICVKNALGLSSATEAFVLTRTMRTGLTLPGLALPVELALFPEEIESKAKQRKRR